MRKLKFLLYILVIFISGNKVEDNTNFIKNNVVTIYTPVGIGSGSIIGKEKNIYYVLTAKHVIKGFKKNDTLEIRTGDGEYWEASLPIINTSKKDIDIALIKFKSNNCYPLANVGIESYFASIAYEPGFPFELKVAGYATVDKSISITPLLRVSPGKVATKIDINTKNGMDELFAAEGYQYGYTAPTARGMSGGPVYLPADGFLQTYLGNSPTGLQAMVHGRGEADNLRGNNKTGFNFAMPTYLLTESLAKNEPDIFNFLNTNIYYINEYLEPDEYGETSEDDLKKLSEGGYNWLYPDGFEVAANICKPKGLIPITPKNADNNNHTPVFKNIYNRLFRK